MLNVCRLSCLMYLACRLPMRLSSCERPCADVTDALRLRLRDVGADLTLSSLVVMETAAAAAVAVDAVAADMVVSEALDELMSCCKCK